MLVNRMRPQVVGAARAQGQARASELFRSGPQLGQVWALQSVLQSALNCVTVAIFILDADRCVVFANAAARAATVVAIAADGKLAAGDANVALRKALTRARAEGRPHNVRIDSEGGAARVATVMPIMRAQRLGPGGASHDYDMVLLADPDRQMAAGVDAVIETFGLTAGEGRVLAALAAGDGLRPAAIELGIGLATARSHLRRVFAKTRTVSQSELMRLVATLAAPARRD